MREFNKIAATRCVCFVRTLYRPALKYTIETQQVYVCVFLWFSIFEISNTFMVFTSFLHISLCSIIIYLVHRFAWMCTDFIIVSLFFLFFMVVSEALVGSY
jgi:hypothetical protein